MMKTMLGGRDAARAESGASKPWATMTATSTRRARELFMSVLQTWRVRRKVSPGVRCGCGRTSLFHQRGLARRFGEALVAEQCDARVRVPQHFRAGMADALSLDGTPAKRPAIFLRDRLGEFEAIPPALDACRALLHRGRRHIEVLGQRVGGAKKKCERCGEVTLDRIITAEFSGQFAEAVGEG